MRTGDTVTRSFAELDGEGRVTHEVRVTGEFLGYHNGYALMRYRTRDLPARYQDGSEFRTIQHETEGE